MTINYLKVLKSTICLCIRHARRQGTQGTRPSLRMKRVTLTPK